jgi:hypothetical protein
MPVDERLTDWEKGKLVELAAGVYVERDVLNIVEKIKEYDENLTVKFCNPSLADPGDAPYKLVERCKDGLERVAFDIWELNELVLERIYAADNQRHDILLDLDGRNLLAAKEQKQRYREKMDEANDIIVSMLKSPKHKWTYKDETTGRVTTFDDREKAYKVETKAV